MINIVLLQKNYIILIVCLSLLSCGQKEYTYLKKDSLNNDLASYQIQDSNANLEYTVYFDEKNEKAALEAIPHLNTIYREVLKFHKTDGEKMNWADIAIVADTSYLAPVSNTTRWVIFNQTEKLSQQAEEQLYDLIGHEQVHAWQKQFSTCNDTPRWFVEGQAAWSESKVTKNLKPKIFEKVNHNRKKEYDKVMKKDGNLNLTSWGGVIVLPETIRKQLTPEGQKYFDKTGKTPPGATFNITPADMTQDNVNQPARYYGSYLLFKKLEDEIGLENLKEWIYETVKSAPCNNEALIKKLENQYNIDISEILN